MGIESTIFSLYLEGDPANHQWRKRTEVRIPRCSPRLEMGRFGFRPWTSLSRGHMKRNQPPFPIALPSGSLLISSSIFLCFRVSTTSARLPLRLSGVPSAVLDKDSPLWRPPSSAFEGEVDELCGANEDITLLPSTSWNRRETRWNTSLRTHISTTPARALPKRERRHRNPLYLGVYRRLLLSETFKRRGKGEEEKK